MISNQPALAVLRASFSNALSLLISTCARGKAAASAAAAPFEMPEPVVSCPDCGNRIAYERIDDAWHVTRLQP